MEACSLICEGAALSARAISRSRGRRGGSPGCCAQAVNTPHASMYTTVVSLRTRTNVGRERSHLLRAVNNNQVVARLHYLRSLQAKRRQELDRRITRLGWPSGKIHFQTVVVTCHGQHAAAGMEANRPHVMSPQREHIGGCQGCVSA